MIATQSFSGNIKPGVYVKLINHIYVPCLSKDKDKIGRCIKLEDNTVFIELKTKKKLEKDVIADFRKYFEKKYPLGDCNLYHLQTGIDGERGIVGKGEAGRPDFELTLSKYPLIAWAIEFKRHDTPEEAENNLSAKQRAMIAKMKRAGRPTYLVYNRGCTEFSSSGNTYLLDNTYQFEAFELLIERRFYGIYIKQERI